MPAVGGQDQVALAAIGKPEGRTNATVRNGYWQGQLAEGYLAVGGPPVPAASWCLRELNGRLVEDFDRTVHDASLLVTR